MLLAIFLMTANMPTAGAVAALLLFMVAIYGVLLYGVLLALWYLVGKALEWRNK